MWILLRPTTPVIVELVLHVPSGQPTDYPCACYRSMANRYDVLEFGFEDTVARPCQYSIAVREFTFANSPPRTDESERQRLEHTCRNSPKLPLRQSHTRL